MYLYFVSNKFLFKPTVPDKKRKKSVLNKSKNNHTIFGPFISVDRSSYYQSDQEPANMRKAKTPLQCYFVIIRAQNDWFKAHFLAEGKIWQLMVFWRQTGSTFVTINFCTAQNVQDAMSFPTRQNSRTESHFFKEETSG